MHSCNYWAEGDKGATVPCMRSTHGDPTPAERTAQVITELATQAGYDLTNRAGGMAQLADDAGISRSAISRTLAGKTLPSPAHALALARTLNCDVQEILEAGEVIPADSSHQPAWAQVRSAPPPPTPDQAADAWGISDHVIRSMLITTIEQAIRLQHGEATETEAADRRP